MFIRLEKSPNRKPLVNLNYSLNTNITQSFYILLFKVIWEWCLEFRVYSLLVYYFRLLKSLHEFSQDSIKVGLWYSAFVDTCISCLLFCCSHIWDWTCDDPFYYGEQMTIMSTGVVDFISYFEWGRQ